MPAFPHPGYLFLVQPLSTSSLDTGNHVQVHQASHPLTSRGCTPARSHQHPCLLRLTSVTAWLHSPQAQGKQGVCVSNKATDPLPQHTESEARGQRTSLRKAVLSRLSPCSLGNIPCHWQPLYARAGPPHTGLSPLQPWALSSASGMSFSEITATLTNLRLLHCLHLTCLLPEASGPLGSSCAQLVTERQRCARHMQGTGDAARNFTDAPLHRAQSASAFVLSASSLLPPRPYLPCTAFSPARKHSCDPRTCLLLVISASLPPGRTSPGGKPAPCPLCTCTQAGSPRGTTELSQAPSSHPLNPAQS